MKKEKAENKRKLCVIILLIFAVLVVTTDLLLFRNSLEEEGVGRGLSRYWDQEK